MRAKAAKPSAIVSRREFCEWLGATSVLAGTRPSVGRAQAQPGSTAPATSSHIGSLYSFVQKQADRSTFEQSYLHDKFRNLDGWQKSARARVLQHLFYEPLPIAPAADVIRREDRSDYVEEYLTFNTSPDLRVPAYLLVPKGATRPLPAVLLLHCHGGVYLWGKEKVVEQENEHAVLREFKQQLYEGKSVANELVRRGYVVLTIDMFYWGERRMLLDDDPPSFRDPRSMTREDISAFNRRSQQSESLVARSLLAAGITWPGVMLWDDRRSLDYLAARPEVDPRRLACVGLSVGGYRSFVLAALDPRIKAAVDVGWMSSFGTHIRRHIVNSIGLTFHIAGLYRYLDLPDLAALIAPRSLFVINGSRDQLFPPEGVRAAFEKIERCFRKAGVADRQRCRLYDAPHEFNVRMQADAWEWLERNV
ncbi:MAG TPA: alpha/beta hydrolase family protein [Vicinamibacterales bacterium]